MNAHREPSFQWLSDSPLQPRSHPQAHGLGDLAGVDKWFGLKLVIDTVGRQVTGYARGGDGDWVRLNETPLPYYDSEAKGTEIFLGIGSRKHNDGVSNVLEMDDIQVMQLTIEGN